MLSECPCWGHPVAAWTSKRPSTWTDAERTHVRLLIVGGCSVSHSAKPVDHDLPGLPR